MDASRVSGYIRSESPAHAVEVWQEGDLVIVVEVTEASDSRFLESILERLVTECPGDFVVALGRIEEGQDAPALSYRQARAVLSLVDRLKEVPLLLRFDEAWPYLPLVRDAELAAFIFRRATWLLELPENKREKLLAVLDAFFDGNRTVAGSARVLRLGERTIRRRIQTIEERSGLRIDRSLDAALLDLTRRALRLTHPGSTLGRNTAILDHENGRNQSLRDSPGQQYPFPHKQRVVKGEGQEA